VGGQYAKRFLSFSRNVLSLPLELLLDHLALLGASTKFAFPAELGHPLSVDVGEVPKELRIPATELADDGFLLDLVLATGHGLVGDLGPVFLHDAEHVTEGREKKEGSTGSHRVMSIPYSSMWDVYNMA